MTSIRHLQADFQEVTVLRDGLIARRQHDGVLYVLKPAASFVDPAVTQWLADAWHTGIPRCVGKTDGPDNNPYYVFEYIPGITLGQLAGQSGRKTELAAMLQLMLQWVQILSYLHLQGVCPLLHLDIKPSNLVVADQGIAGMIDFTTARILDKRDLDSGCAQMKALTPNYAAPELSGGKPCPGSDLYALGLSVLVALTGLSPAKCRSQPLHEVLDGAPATVQTLFGRCLHTEPAQRFADAEMLAYEIRQVMVSLETDTMDQCLTDQERSPAGPFQSVPTETQDQSVQTTPEPALQEKTASAAERLPATVISVWDGPACGCELAAILAERQDVLVVDANLLNPRADLLLGQSGRMYRDPLPGSRQGLDLAFQAEQEGRLSPQLLRKQARETAVPGVRLLDGIHHLEAYEYCHLDSLYQTLRWARLITDVVVVLCNRSIFDAFTCLSLMTADKVVVPLGGHAGDFREVNRAVAFLTERYHIKLSKLHYVAFPYNRQTDLSRGTMNELCEGRLAGCISDMAKRYSRSCRPVPYAAALTEQNKQEYRHLIRCLQLPVTGKKGA